MTKSHSTPPKMGNNGGTAFVRINGKRIYLGKFGSPEAAQNYARCVAEWAISNTDPGQMSMPIGTATVNTLAIAYLDHVQQNNPNRYYEARSAIKTMLQLYSGITVDAFTPKCLAAVQHQFSQQVCKSGKPYSRQYCNDLSQTIKQMFRWGVAQELVSPVTADALKYVPALRLGRTTAPESTPRKDVPDDVVASTLPHLLPTVAAMVQVQRWATMRRAIERANRSLPKEQQILHWTPYQLRHAGVTELILENDGDRDVARAVAGQKSIAVTQDYNHADLKIAIEQAKKRAKKRGQPEAEQLEGQPES